MLKCDKYQDNSLFPSSDKVGNSNESTICTKTDRFGCTKCDCLSQGQEG